MPCTGFGTTLVGSVTGAITGIKEISIGGLKVSMINSVKLDDTNHVSSNLKGAVTEGPITATIAFEKAVYEALQAASLEETAEDWTLTDAEGNIWTGDGWVSGLSNARMTSGSENVFDLEISPVDFWGFTKISG